MCPYSPSPSPPPSPYGGGDGDAGKGCGGEDTSLAWPVPDRPGTGHISRFVPVVFVMQGKSDIINYFHFNYFLFYIFS